MRPALLGISGAVEVPQPQPLGSLRAAKERPRWWRARFPGPSVFSQPIHPPGGLRSHPVTPVRAQDVSTGHVERVPFLAAISRKHGTTLTSKIPVKPGRCCLLWRPDDSRRAKFLTIQSTVAQKSKIRTG